MSEVVAIIPARGGSKRIPRKNIKDFLGKPILAYSIEAAQRAGCFTEVMVSTDDEEIAEVARKYGASVPFIRNSKTAGDHSSTSDVLLEVIQEYKAIQKTFDSICCIYATAPFIKGQKLKEAYDLLIADKLDSVLAVTEYSFPILRSLKINDKSQVAFYWPENALKRSQDLEKAYHDCGQFYFLNRQVFVEKKSLITENTSAIILRNMEVQDIDSEDDWKMAEIKFNFLQNER